MGVTNPLHHQSVSGVKGFNPSKKNKLSCGLKLLARKKRSEKWDCQRIYGFEPLFDNAETEAVKSETVVPRHSTRCFVLHLERV